MQCNAKRMHQLIRHSLFFPRLANVYRYRTRNFFASVRETRVSRRTDGRALYVDPQSDCAFVIRPSNFIGSLPSVRSIDPSIDPLVNRTTAISVPVRFFTSCRFRFSRLDRAFFLGCFRSTVSLCFFPCSFLVSASLALSLSSSVLPMSIRRQLLHCRFFYRNFVWTKASHAPFAISEYQSARKSIERTFVHSVILCVHIYIVQENKKIVHWQFWSC